MDLSNLLGGLGGAEGADAAANPTAATQGIQQLLSQEGGVNGLIEKLRAGGLGPQVDSWVSTGENEPVAPNELAGALGPDTVNSLASSTGLSIQSLLPLLAGLLPMIINHLTPNGTTPQPGEAANQPDLGGLLGGLLGGGGLGGILGGR
jgi:uncharacterized protein YidB (DUF937 family)